MCQFDSNCRCVATPRAPRNCLEIPRTTKTLQPAPLGHGCPSMGLAKTFPASGLGVIRVQGYFSLQSKALSTNSSTLSQLRLLAPASLLPRNLHRECGPSGCQPDFADADIPCWQHAVIRVTRQPFLTEILCIRASPADPSRP